LIEKDGVLEIHRGNTKHIGDINEEFEGYKTTAFELEINASIYMFSDGFQDQFGGDRDKKYSTKKLIALLQSNIKIPMKTQGKLVQEEYDLWKSGRTQTDDITVIGIKNPRSTK
jgi:serine phosphatase RsbU (regulator of sigma subunit)